MSLILTASLSCSFLTRIYATSLITKYYGGATANITEGLCCPLQRIAAHPGVFICRRSLSFAPCAHPLRWFGLRSRAGFQLSCSMCVCLKSACLPHNKSVLVVLALASFMSCDRLPAMPAAMCRDFVGCSRTVPQHIIMLRHAQQFSHHSLMRKGGPSLAACICCSVFASPSVLYIFGSQVVHTPG